MGACFKSGRLYKKHEYLLKFYGLVIFFLKKNQLGQSEYKLNFAPEVTKFRGPYLHWFEGLIV